MPDATKGTPDRTVILKTPVPKATLEFWTGYSVPLIYTLIDRTELIVKGAGMEAIIVNAPGGAITEALSKVKGCVIHISR
jgi:hypothetical protein